MKESKSFDEELFRRYDEFKAEGLDRRRVKQSFIHDLVWTYEKQTRFSVSEIGRSTEDRPISLVTLGSGDVKVMLWAQMHGNESTSSRALFDIFKFLKASDDGFDELRDEILNTLTIHIIPVLNPDGAERFNRLNAIGIDLNRDADSCQAPESQILKEAIHTLKPVFGFNLHDQNRVYMAGNSGLPATMSFLAPPYDEDRQVNDIRMRSMQLIGYINDVVQKYIPGQVGKFSDEFEPRAFGDNITKWGTSVVLFESGGFPGDREKVRSRKVHFVAILSALSAIAEKEYAHYSTKEYDQIPFNSKNMMDVIVRSVSYHSNGKTFSVDLGIDWAEIELSVTNQFYLKGSLEEVGDLSVHRGYQEFDGEGLRFQAAKVYPQVLDSIHEVGQLNLEDLHQQGYGWVIVKSGNPGIHHAPGLMNVIIGDVEPPIDLFAGINPTFCLKDEQGNLKYLFINGFEVSGSDETKAVQKGIILR